MVFCKYGVPTLVLFIHDTCYLYLALNPSTRTLALSHSRTLALSHSRNSQENHIPVPLSLSFDRYSAAGAHVGRI